MSECASTSRLADVRLIDAALTGSLFERLVAAVCSIGREGLKGSYKRTFWYVAGAEPTNVVEEVIVELSRLARPSSACVGMEWWLGALRPGKKLRLHFDRDLALEKRTGEYSHPICGSILYLNEFDHSPTVILQQVPGPGGRSRVPEKPRSRMAIDPFPNLYVVFPGDLRHGVVPEPNGPQGGDVRDAADLRLSLLVNYWARRPLPPTCLDYDGTVYPSLRSV